MPTKTTNNYFWLLERGTRDWGTYTNQNWDVADTKLTSLDTRITSIETTNDTLPLALSNKIGHNLIKNCLFIQSSLISPENPSDWISQFENGGTGFATRDPASIHVGGFSQRISLVNVNLSQQTRPWIDLQGKIYDTETDLVISNSDPRGILLTNSFGYSYQSIALQSQTKYTLSCYGKVDIVNLSLGINSCWKIGIVFKDQLDNIVKGFFTEPQLYTGTNFNRTELTFTTPQGISFQKAEVWLVCQGVNSSSIGTSWFSGVQLEQSSRATQLETFSASSSIFTGNNKYTYQFDGDVSIKGNLILSQREFQLNTDLFIVNGNIQLGVPVSGNLVNVLDVYCTRSTFYGDTLLNGSTFIGNDASETGDIVAITAYNTRFYDNQNIPSVGGNVVIDGNLEVKKVSTLNELSISGDLQTAENLSVAKKAIFGSSLSDINDINNSFFVNSPTTLRTGIELEGWTKIKRSTTANLLDLDRDIKIGSLIIDENLTIGSGANTSSFSANVKSAHFIESHLTIDNGISVVGPTEIDCQSNQFSVQCSDGSILADDQLSLSGSNISITGNIDSTGTTNNQIYKNVVLGDSLDEGDLTLDFTDTNLSGNLIIGDNLSIGGNLQVDGYQLNFSNQYFYCDSIQKIVKIGGIDYTTDGQGRKVYDSIIHLNGGLVYIGNQSSPLDEEVGDVIIGGSLRVGGAVSLGNDSSLTSDPISFKSNQISIDVGSGKLTIGGGYVSTRIFDSFETDHGGITIDNNGNISCNGSFVSKGNFDVQTLTLKSNILSVDGSAAFNVVNQSGPDSLHITEQQVFNIDNLGNVDANGYVYLTAGQNQLAESSFCDGYLIDGKNIVDPTLTKTILIKNSQQDSFEVDNYGNAKFSGKIITKDSGTSNLSTSSVTIGDGVSTFGDFNQVGLNSSNNPIQQAIDYIVNTRYDSSLGATIFIKRGIYSICEQYNITDGYCGIIVPAGISIVGESAATIINSLSTRTDYSAIVISGEYCQVRDISLQDCLGTSITINQDYCQCKVKISNSGLYGIVINSNQNKITESFIENCDTGIEIISGKQDNIISENHFINNNVEINDSGLNNIIDINVGISSLINIVDGGGAFD